MRKIQMVTKNYPTIVVLLVHMFLLGVSMLWQTGYISSIGIKKMYKEGKIDKKRMLKYIVSQYLSFCDKKVLSKIVGNGEI